MKQDTQCYSAPKAISLVNCTECHFRLHHMSYIDMNIWCSVIFWNLNHRVPPKTYGNILVWRKNQRTDGIDWSYWMESAYYIEWHFHSLQVCRQDVPTSCHILCCNHCYLLLLTHNSRFHTWYGAWCWNNIANEIAIILSWLKPSTHCNILQWDKCFRWGFGDCFSWIVEQTFPVFLTISLYL